MPSKIYGIFRNNTEGEYEIFNLTSVTTNSKNTNWDDLRRVDMLGPLFTIHECSRAGRLVFRFLIAESHNLVVSRIFEMADIEELGGKGFLQSIGERSFSMSKYPNATDVILNFRVLDQEMDIAVHFGDFLAACRDIWMGES